MTTNLNIKTVEKEVDIGRGVIHCTLRGEGPVVCLSSTLSGTWLYQAKLLRKEYTVLTFDMRGYGHSITREPGFPLNEAHAEDLKMVLEHLGFYKVVLVGLSHGGAVAQHFAVNFPEYLRGLVIVSSLAKASGSTFILLNLLHGFLKRGDIETFWEVLKAFLFSEKNLSRVPQDEDNLKRLMFNQYTCESLEHIYACSLKHDTREILPQIKIPTMVVGGSEDILFPPRITDEIAALIPGAQKHLLETAHLPPIEDPKGFHSILEEFLKTL
ncbi:alpha/beta hydrolase [Plectonema radiosum NIES-515]|uniref:Alpha/beta hydrolase n=1 Tax=Plectonema radiosum NIES-515 TaxID=2986073 RepID=A0ABT3B5B6_9CYAN|nr:alpha/beta hydrolase [Plectonema radiosum]MCV3216578.1 alpha/beta hydrolase [Plectonema radiosum NIES-515]